jgi:hypothetical protein
MSIRTLAVSVAVAGAVVFLGTVAQAKGPSGGFGPAPTITSKQLNSPGGTLNAPPGWSQGNKTTNDKWGSGTPPGFTNDHANPDRWGGQGYPPGLGTAPGLAK